MKLRTAYARFYKSFNFDQVRKLGATEHMPWEEFRGQIHPYVVVPLENTITTVVGANESGKSHLLEAIKQAITGQGIEQRDLCRYSPYFGVAQGQRCFPHVGVGWDDVSTGEAEEIARIAGTDIAAFERFVMFREAPDHLAIWLPGADGAWAQFQLDGSARKELAKLLPQPFEIKPDIAVPNSIPFAYLLNGKAAPEAEVDRGAARQLIDAIPQLQGLISADATRTASNAAQIFKLMAPLFQTAGQALTEKDLQSLELGRRLLIELGNVDPESLNELARAVDEGQEGYASALLRSINQQLDRQLNFRRYWVQDRDFGLRVIIRHRELAFTITDRTGTEYMFSERSSGLRYFLSYLIQAQVHRPTSKRETILLMDEPDTYLSAEAQQDLMRVFRDLADPIGDREAIQIVYVTHSPFLLDKNHAERIRVLEKGTISDGTRVVPNVTRNHYEPLRSAFGAFVGETAFVGAVNLLVEGPADQIILAAAAAEIRRRSPQIELDSLDFNRVVIVPCGSAGEVPHTLFRVRGQGADKPPTVILLDSDASGLDAKKQLLGDKMLQRNISPALVLDLASVGEGQDWPKVVEIEDLCPPSLAHAAVSAYVDEVMKYREGTKPTFSLDAIANAIAQGGPLIDAVNRVVAKSKGKIEKAGFAKAIANIVANGHRLVSAADVDLFLERMRTLFRAVNRARVQAEREAGTQRLDALVEQRARLFKMDHPTHATCEMGRVVLEEIEANLNMSVEADAIRNDIVILRRDFHLDGEAGDPIEPYPAFLEQLIGLKHSHRRTTAPPTRPAAPGPASQKPKAARGRAKKAPPPKPSAAAPNTPKY